MNSTRMLERIFGFYHRAQSQGPIELAEVWQSVTASSQKDVIAALKSRDGDAMQLLLDRAVDYGSFGIEHSIPPWGAEPLQNHLKSLCHSLGILPVFNPEQSWVNNHTLTSYTQLIPKAEELTGFKFRVSDLYGFNAAVGIPYRYLFYVAAAHAARCHLQRSPGRILELGAGFGDLGFIAQQWRASAYTVIDLPQTAVLSAYFMAQCVGEENIWFYGETECDAFARFYPANDYQPVSNLGPYDLIWNSDSLPEMTQASQDCYLKLFFNVLANDGIFISVNHEASNNGQSSVWDAIQRHGGFKQAARFPFMQRPGYMLEIFKK